MKQFSKLKLSQLSKAELKKREMSQILGGGSCCGCGCSGPSSMEDNYTANYYGGFPESSGGAIVCAYHGDPISISSC